MQTSFALQLDTMPPVAFSDHGSQLKVVLVYEDFEMGVQGKQVFDLLAKEAGEESAARLTVWRFDFFHSAELTQAVARQAEEADVIIVAPRDPDHLPPQVKAWLEQWPQLRKAETGALVAVFHPDVTDATARTSNAALLLWRAACRAQMDFICRKPGASTSGLNATESVTAAPPTALNHPITITYNFPTPDSGWGINE